MKSAAPATPKKTKKRVRSIPKYRTFRLSKKRLKQPDPLPGGWRLTKDTWRILKRNKKLFGGVTLIYGIIAFIFVQGAGSSFQITQIKDGLNEAFGTGSDGPEKTLALFGYLMGTAGSSVNEVGSAYQLFLVLIVSLATIWSVRQVQAGENPGIRDAFYKGIYPLIPFIMVLFVIGLQLLPLIIGNTIYSTVLQNGIAATVLEKALWLLLFILLALLSMYMVVSSIFSLYIVTLPDMRPIRALRSARELVLHRRFAVSLRIVVLPVLFIIVSGVVFIPLLLIVPQVAEALFLVATGLGLVVLHVYMYLLYRALI